MGKELVSDELWEAIEPLLPPVGDAPRRDGLRVRLDLLAEAARLAGGQGVATPAPGLARPPCRSQSDRLVEGAPGLGERARKKRGERIGKNPTDRGKPGSKRHLASDRKGVPLTVALTAANVHDSRVFEEMVDAVEPIKRPGRGRPRKRLGGAAARGASPGAG